MSTRLRRPLLSCILLFPAITAPATNSTITTPATNSTITAPATNSTITAPATNSITLEDITHGIYRAKGVGDIQSMNDGKSYARLSDDGKLILQYDYQSGKLIDTLFNADATRNSKNATRNVKIEHIEGFVFNSQETKILLHENVNHIYRRSYTADYYVYDRHHNIIEALSDNGAQRDATFSPDGRMVAFARDNNLYIKKLDFKTEIAVTTDGLRNSVINGTSDWLYEEEFMTTRMYEWTSDSRYLLYVRFDERSVKEYSFPLYSCDMPEYEKYRYYPGEMRFKYPRAGETNSKVSLRAYNVQYRTNQVMNLPLDTTDYIPYLIPTCQTSQMAVATINRNQNTFKLFYVNPKSNTNRTVLTETNERYVDPTWLPYIEFTSKDFTYISEKDGYRHLYLYGLNGILKAQITKGENELLDYYGRDTVNNLFYYCAVDGLPYRSTICKSDAKGKTACICQGTGTHHARFNSSFTYFIDSYSNVSTPAIHTLCKADGKQIRVIQGNEELRKRLENTPHSEKEWFETPAADGTPLYGWIIKPSDFNPDKQYPLLLVQYSGPDNSFAIDEYDFDWEYFLAQEGYIVAAVDGRGTGGRGENFRKQTYCHLGQMETADQTEVARALGTRSYIDASRIGIWGWSYGGYMTLMCMTQPTPVFKAGISVAPVTDYRYYNTAYTERFMRSPQENPEGYADTDIMNRIDNLQGSLLLVHGLADDNVHVNQSMELVDALVRAGKQFDMQFYPNRNHSILGTAYRTHLYNRWWKFLQENL